LAFALFSDSNAPKTDFVSAWELSRSANTSRLADVANTTRPISNGTLTLNFIYFLLNVLKQNSVSGIKTQFVSGYILQTVFFSSVNSLQRLFEA